MNSYADPGQSTELPPRSFRYQELQPPSSQTVPWSFWRIDSENACCFSTRTSIARAPLTLDVANALERVLDLRLREEQDRGKRGSSRNLTVCRAFPAPAARRSGLHNRHA